MINDALPSSKSRNLSALPFAFALGSGQDDASQSMSAPYLRAARKPNHVMAGTSPAMTENDMEISVMENPDTRAAHLRL